MNKASMINELAKKTGVSKPIVEDVVNAIFDEIIVQLQSNNSVTFAGFGTFSPKERHARMGVNPLKPTEKIQMPATVVPKFKAGKTLKDALKASSVVASADDSDPTDSNEGSEENAEV